MIIEEVIMIRIAIIIIILISRPDDMIFFSTWGNFDLISYWLSSVGYSERNEYKKRSKLPKGVTAVGDTPASDLPVTLEEAALGAEPFEVRGGSWLKCIEMMVIRGGITTALHTRFHRSNIMIKRAWNCCELRMKSFSRAKFEIFLLNFTEVVKIWQNIVEF